MTAAVRVTSATAACLVIPLVRLGVPSRGAAARAGLVADSRPDLEYQETLQKAQRMLSALDIANAWAVDAQA